MVDAAAESAGSPIGSKSRKIARICAFQALYMLEVGESDGPAATSTVLEHQPLLEPALGFLKQEMEGVWLNLDSIDAIISRFLAAGWSINRLAVTDRIALRIGIYEIYHLPGMPPKVSISEAVNLAKKFGSAESGRFVNGVLANVLNVSPKSTWDPALAETMQEDDQLAESAILGDDADSESEAEVAAGSAEHEEILKAGPWVIRTEPNRQVQGR